MQMTNECEWRKEINGIGICGLHILPCGKVMKKGLCEYWVRVVPENERISIIKERGEADE